MHGGSQERYRRAGTENVAGAVGMAAAFELAAAERAATVAAVRGAARPAARGRSWPSTTWSSPGHPVERLPGSLSVIVRGVLGDDLVMALDLEGVACSTGSACTTGSSEPSHVLRAMGYPPSEARGSLRLSLGRTHERRGRRRAAAAIVAAGHRAPAHARRPGAGSRGRDRGAA